MKRKDHKNPNWICECGNEATIKKWGRNTFICQRCNRIEELLERDNFFLKTVKPLEGDDDDEDFPDE